MTIPADRLVAEALSKSGLLWVSSDAGSSPVWYAHNDGVAYLVSGPGEQFCPPHQGVVNVVARSKDTRARLACFDAVAQTVAPTDDEWEQATSALKAGRLNATDSDMVSRWAVEGTVLKLVPDLATVVVRGELLAAPQAATKPASEIAADVTPPADVTTHAAPPAPRNSAKKATKTTRQPIETHAASAAQPSGKSETATQASPSTLTPSTTTAEVTQPLPVQDASHGTADRHTEVTQGIPVRTALPQSGSSTAKPHQAVDGRAGSEGSVDADKVTP